MNQDDLRVLEFGSWNDQVAARARLRAGREAARGALPATDLNAARVLLSETREAIELIQEDLVPLPRVEEDGLNLLAGAREQGTPLLARELAILYRFLREARDLRLDLLTLEGQPALCAIGAVMPDLGEFVQQLQTAVDDGGHLLDSATPRLRQLRLEITEQQEQVRRDIERFANRQDIRPLLRSGHPSIRDGRLVLAVRSGARGQIHGLYHDRSATGQTVYVEPESVIDAQNRLRDLRIDEEREVGRILWSFTRQALDLEQELQGVRSQVARFDLACARAKIAMELGLAEPELVEGGSLEVADVRHPLLLAMACDRAGDGDPEQRLEEVRRTVVPFSLRLGDAFDVLVLTGPNTGGKTVTLKAIGLLALLARTGSFVPAAAGARIPWYPGVYADVGDEQDLAQSLSTFSGHISRISYVLRTAQPGSLVLLDELGSGTDPLEGEALSSALLDHMLERGLLAVVTTHLGRLKEFAGSRARAANASMQFDPDSLRPTYRLILGVPGASNALRIASHLGVPADVLERADELLEESRHGSSELFDQLDRARATVERLRGEAEEDRRAAAQSRNVAKELEQRVSREKASLMHQAELAAESRLRRLAAEVEEPRRTMLRLGGQAAVAAGKMMDAMRRALAASPLAEDRRRFVRSLSKGDKVFLPRYNEVCRIRRIIRKEERVEVDYRAMSVTVSYDEIAPAGQSHLYRESKPG